MSTSSSAKSLPQTIEPTPEQFQDFLGAEIQGPIQMVNLLRFKADGGRETYRKYMKAVEPVLLKVNGKMISWHESRITVIGPDSWDAMLIVEYPSKRAFYELIRDPEYQQIAPIRNNALVDSRLHCTQVSRP